MVRSQQEAIDARGNVSKRIQLASSEAGHRNQFQQSPVRSRGVRLQHRRQTRSVAARLNFRIADHRPGIRFAKLRPFLKTRIH